MGCTCVFLLCSVLFCLSDGLSTDEDSNLSNGVAQRGSHRNQLLIPLLLRISTRLATLVPTVIMGVAGIFLFVAFSKKALIISLLALFLTFLEKKKHQPEEENLLQIHRIKYLKDLEEFDHFHHNKWHHEPYRIRFMSNS